MILGECSKEDFVETLAEQTISRRLYRRRRFREDFIGENSSRISDDKQQYRLKRLGFKRRMMKLVGFFFQHRKFS